MEQTTEIIVPEIIQPIQIPKEGGQTDNTFIEANTIRTSLEEIKTNHIIPVFVKDNETLISHADFIETSLSLAADIFPEERILTPNIRVSHPIKGRVPEAKDKPANQLEEWEKTLYFERMAFVIEIPSIQSEIDGNILSLTLGGVKSYNQDNLYSRSTCDQHFKMFIGFQNKVCTNMCVWTDGFNNDVKVKSIGQLKSSMRALIEGYNKNFHIHHLNKLTEYSITEHQFAQLIGRCRMYNHLPSNLKAGIPPILFGDQQMSAVVKDFYKDESFCRDDKGNINLWRLYNLFTETNKSSYIDSFLDKSINAYNFTEQIRWALEGKGNNWYLQ